MTTSARSLCAAVFALNVLTMASVVAEEPPAVEAKAAFAKLKTLAGEWKSETEGHEHPGGKVVYRTTAAGSTVMETLHAGAAHEMVSMYHLDGDDLRMTHYCAAGNQPRLKLDRKASKPDDLRFVFDGGTNLDPAKDMHIHNMRLIFRDKDHIDAEWEGYQDGKSTGLTKFSIARP